MVLCEGVRCVVTQHLHLSSRTKVKDSRVGSSHNSVPARHHRILFNVHSHIAFHFQTIVFVDGLTIEMD